MSKPTPQRNQCHELKRASIRQDQKVKREVIKIRDKRKNKWLLRRKAP